MLIAFFLGFVNPDPFLTIRQDGFMKSLQELLRIFIGTALFEEVFFRGLLQNDNANVIMRLKMTLALSFCGLQEKKQDIYGFYLYKTGF